MSGIVANYIGSLDEPVIYPLTNSVKTTIFTVEAKGRTLATASFTNANGGAHSCKLHFEDISAATEYTIWAGSVASNTTEIAEVHIRTQVGDVIKVTGGTDVTVVLEFIAQLENAR
jgi:hypothetical protein